MEDVTPQGIRKDCGALDVSLGRCHDQEKTTKYNIFHKLNIHYQCQKLRLADFLQITPHSIRSYESCGVDEIVQAFIQKLLMMNYRARYIHVKETIQHYHTQQSNSESSIEEGDIYNELTFSNKEISHSEGIHPMDVQMAVFHSSDGFLKQLMVSKLSQCQFALPLLVPHPFTQQIEFPLWTFRQINKSWKSRDTSNKIISQTQAILKAETPMVFFFRFGSVSVSKSQLMNSLINDKHNTFFHRNCPGSSRTRVLMNGVVEIAWFCPSGKNSDQFNGCVAFCNLHGDAEDHEKQLQILTEMASVNVAVLPKLDKNTRSIKLEKLYKHSKPLICLFTEDESSVCKTRKGKYKIGLKDRNLSDVSEEIKEAINNCLPDSSSFVRLEDFKHSDIRVDEEGDEDYIRGRDAAQHMMSLLEKKDLRAIKESLLPHQGTLWHQWSQKNKEISRPQGGKTPKYVNTIQKKEMEEIRQKQHKIDMSVFMKHFFKYIEDEHVNNIFFLTFLRILLVEHTSGELSYLHHKYNEKWSTILKLRNNHGSSQELMTEQSELESISEDLQAATFGLEHIMREIGQIYESCESVRKNKKDLQVQLSSLPSLAADMMMSGFPLELMDGDAGHVPLVWISAVLDQLIHKLGDQTRVFVLSVLGLQSSGKSTMLNAMFGLQFAVSAGRCTRGAFMQLIKVSDEMKTQMNSDFIMVVDTEGLHAPELSGRSTRDHDNELATFVLGLANLTLINIFGENLSEIQDILQIVVQAIMRIKKAKLNPSCVFVHQNISDVTAGEKNMEGRRRLKEKLDEMTKLYADDEVYFAERFSDVIRFDVLNDVKYLAQLWEGNPPMAPPNPNYCENVQELKETIISHKIKSHGRMIKDVKDSIKNLWEDLLTERFIFSFRNSLEISVYRKLETEYSKWSWSLCSAIMEIEKILYKEAENKNIEEINIDEKLKETWKKVEKSMLEFFENDKNKDILIQWKTLFENKIKDLQENYVSKTKQRLNEILQQQDLKKKIEAQMKDHEKTLYEKSKELALKFKDQIDNENTVKEVFDSFWTQNMKDIIYGTPEIKDIDMIRDVREILTEISGITPIGHERKKSNILNIQHYSDYVILRTSTKTQCTLSQEDEAQIRSLVKHVSEKAEKTFKLLNISKMGYNKSYIQQLISYIKTKVTEHQESQVKYRFKNEFFVDLVYCICEKSNKMITDQHRSFKENNNPCFSLNNKREEYYRNFHRSTSTVNFAEIICEKLKEPFEQNVHMNTVNDLKDEMKSKCKSLGNRSILETHILKTLAEEEDFRKYMNYIHTPTDHFKSFIRNEVSRYTNNSFFSESVSEKMTTNIEDQQKKIRMAADYATEHVQVHKGDFGLWLRSFQQRIPYDLIFTERERNASKNVCFETLVKVLQDKIPTIKPDISRALKKNDYTVTLENLFIDLLCQGCWDQCPFCGAICTNPNKNHDEDHSVPFHRNTGLNGWHYKNTKNLSISICTSAVKSANFFQPKVNEMQIRWKDYRNAGGVYAKWSIIPVSELPYWKWFVVKFKENLQYRYKKTYEGYGEIPEEWRKYSKEEAIKSLNVDEDTK